MMGRRIPPADVWAFKENRIGRKPERLEVVTSG
jgi:hypothetical protein